MEMSKKVTVTVLWSFLWSNITMASPVGGSVVAGQAAISQQGSLTQITQNTENAIINWQSFNTTASEHVNFTQPNAQAIALNRITSGLPTQFGGLLTANGHVWIVNPAGVFFTGTSKIDTAGLLATTLDIKNSDFMNGHYHFTAVPGYTNTSVINNGEINTIQDDGLVALVAPGVENNGVIIANAGKVVMASGTDLTLDLYGDNLITFDAGTQVNQTPIDQNGNPLSNAVSNTGKIEANNNGQVLITANAAEKVVQNVVSMTGVIEAKNAVQSNSGVIILGGSEGVTHVGGAITSNHVKIKGHHTIVDGTINVPAGGALETSGDVVDVNNATLNLGPGSSWLIDPVIIEFTTNPGGHPECGVTATCIDPNTVVTTLNGGTDVTEISSGGGDINILSDGAISGWTQSILTLNSSNDINIGASISQSGGTATLDLIASHQININTNTISMDSSTGTQKYESPVIVSNANLNLTGNQVIFSSTVDGPGALTITGKAAFNGDVGFTTPLDTLTVTQQANINSTNIDAVNVEDFQGPVVLGHSASFSTTAFFGLIDFENTVSGTGFDLTASSPGTVGTVEFGGNIGSSGARLGNINLSAGEIVEFNNGISVFANTLTMGGSFINDLNASAINTTGIQTYNDPVTLLSNSALTGSTIIFNSTLDGAFGLGINGNVNFNGDVGTTTPLTNITVSGSSNTATINASQIITGNGGGQGQVYNGPVSIEKDTALSGYNIIFASTVDNFDAITPHSLTITVPEAGNGAVDFVGDVGQTNPLGSLTVNGLLTFGTLTSDPIVTGVKTTGDQTYNDYSPGPPANTVGEVFIFVPNVVTHPTFTFLSTGGNITFNIPLLYVGNGTKDVAISANNTATLNNRVGEDSTFNGSTPFPLKGFSVTGSAININTDIINTTGLQDYKNSVVFNTPIIDLNASDVTFESGVTTAALLTPALTIIGANTIEFDGNVGTPISPLGDINLVTSGGAITLANGINIYANSLSLNGAASGDNIGAALINTVGSQTYADPVFLTNVILGINASDVIFEGNVTTAINNAPFFTINASNLIEFDGNVGTSLFRLGSINLTTTGGTINFNNAGSLFANTLTTNGSTVDNLNVSDINTTISQTYNDPVVLANSVVNMEGVNIIFNNTLDSNTGNESLITTATFSTQFNNTVGGNQPLLSVWLKGSTNEADINANMIKTFTGIGGFEDFEGPVVIKSDTSLISGAIDFFMPVNNDAGTPHNLTITPNSAGGNALFLDADIGQTTPLGSLTVNGQIYLNGGLADLLGITTIGDQNYYDYDGSPTPVTNPVANINIQMPTSFVNPNYTFFSLSGNITFNIPMLFASSSTKNIQIIANNVNFNNRVGEDTPNNLSTPYPLPSLNVFGNTNINTDIINTTGDQTYSGAVTLSNNNVNLIGGLITFQNTVDGASDLTVTGNADFVGDVGDSINLNSISVSGSTGISSLNVITTGQQNYSGPVVLLNGLFATDLSGSLITFSSTLNGANDLTVTGDAVFQGDVGMTTFLESLDVTGQTTFGAGVSNVKTFGDQTFEGPVTLNSSMLFTGISFGSRINFENTVQGGGDNLTVHGGSIFFNGNVGAVGNPLGNIDLSTVSLGQVELNNGIQVFANSLNIHDAGVIVLGASDIHTLNDQIYDDFVLLNNSPLNLEAANITFGSSVTDLVGVNLSPTVTGTITFQGPVNVASLTLNSPTIVSNSMTTTGAQNYNDGITLTSNTLLIASNVTINNGITGNSNSIDIDAVNTVINGALTNVGSLSVLGTDDSLTPSNSFALNAGAIQIWNISGTSSGSISGIGSFSNIQTITGGAVSDTFTFADGATMTSVNGGGGNTTLDLSGYIVSHPVSVIMSNLPSASGTAYSALIGGSTIDTSSPITGFSNITTVKGNSNGFFQVPSNKQGNFSFLTQTPISSTQFIGTGSISDPIDFENFIFFFPAANPVPGDIPNILDGAIPVFAVASGCTGDNCEGADVVIIAGPEENETFERTPIGTVGCLYGFSEAVSSTGAVRILLPGDAIYSDDKVVSDGPTCVKPLNSSDKQACMTNQNQSN